MSIQQIAMAVARSVSDADAYAARVVADGGLVQDATFVADLIALAKSEGFWTTIVHCSAATMGYKQSAGVLETLYCLKGADAVQATSGNRPGWISNGSFLVNTRPVATFDGVDNYLSIASGITSDPAKLTALQIVNTTGGGNALATPFSHRDDSTRIVQFLLINTADCRLTLRDSASTLIHMTEGTGFTTTHGVICGVMDRVADSHRFRRNAATAITSTQDFGANTFSSSLNTIGATHDGSAYANFYKGNIAFTIVIEDALTAGQETALRNFLNSYYTIF